MEPYRKTLVLVRIRTSNNDERSQLRLSCANRPNVNSRQIQIDSFHLPARTNRSPWLPDWHCKSDKEGKKEKKGERERGESFVQSTVQFSSTLPLFKR